jgi:hypothetical protein
MDEALMIVILNLFQNLELHSSETPFALSSADTPLPFPACAIDTAV